MTQIVPRQLQILNEPLLSFGHNQNMHDPKDGLYLFGPIEDARRPLQMRIGLVGTEEGISRYKRWVQTIINHIPAQNPDLSHHKGFPGFESTFGVKWPIKPMCELVIPTSCECQVKIHPL